MRTNCTVYSSILSYIPGETGFHCISCETLEPFGAQAGAVFSPYHKVSQSSPANILCATEACRSCGATVQASQEIATKECPFCGGVLRRMPTPQRFLEPEYI